jgi:hypothetical protein
MSPLTSKEATMRYKSIILELLEQHPPIMEQLQSHRLVPAALDHYAGILKIRHEAWKTLISQSKPESHESQIASEALEIALEEIQGRLPSGSTPDDSETLSLESAMAFIRRRTPPG